MNEPNLFLIGAPKTGTTALFDYLSTHPGVFTPDVKEPHGFSTDFPKYGYGWLNGVERWGRPLTRDEYLRLYRQASPMQTVRVDGSVLYLLSQVAVPQILAFNPAARFVVMLRDPVDLVHAWHATMVKDCVEPEPDFERAWRLQRTRADGHQLPSSRFCPEPIVLQYAQVGRLGEQLQRVIDCVPEAQLRVYRFEEFAQSPRDVYQDVLRFAGLPDDGRRDFPRINGNGVRRLSGVSRFLKRPPFPLNYLKAAARFCLHRTVGVQKTWRLAESATTRTRTRQPLNAEFRAELEDCFRADVELLNGLLASTPSLADPLRHWRPAEDALPRQQAACAVNPDRLVKSHPH